MIRSFAFALPLSMGTAAAAFFTALLVAARFGALSFLTASAAGTRFCIVAFFTAPLFIFLAAGGRLCASTVSGTSIRIAALYLARASCFVITRALATAYAPKDSSVDQ
jgi:hypothetical protein